MNYHIPTAGKYHFFVGSDNMLTIHTKDIIKKADMITVKGRQLIVIEVRADQVSNYHANHRYYELKFKNINAD